MSRCFPFPPPGYEKKIRTDEADPLLKEKYKEKKHKKDKEKKEGKEKRSKDKSKDKQKERKEKKDKHKSRKDKEKDKEKNKPFVEKKPELLTNAGQKENHITNTVQNNSNGDSKYVQDLVRRIRDDEAATGSRSAQKSHYPRPIEETSHRVDDDKRINNHKTLAVAKSSENAVSRASFSADQKKADVMAKPVENRDQARQIESAEKSHRKESLTKSDKPRDQEGVKKNIAKDKDRTKEKKEEKTASINQTRQEKPKSIGGPGLEEREKDCLDIRNCKPPDLSRVSVKNLVAEGNLGKRKDHMTNGFIYENGTTPHKLQRHSASAPSVKNGRTLSEPATPPMPASEALGTTCKPQTKEVGINGFAMSGEKQKVSPLNPLAETKKVKVKENGEASTKPPHPDLKYLNEILNVPKRELSLEVDDQEWLLGNSGSKLKKARTDSPNSDESVQVWNKSVRIESADITALPYVVPF